MNGPQFHENALDQIRTSLGWVIQSDRLDKILSQGEKLA